MTSESGVQVGAVFTSTDALYLTSFRNDVLKMFLFAAIAALTISFFAVGLFSYKMVRPLREMAEAARCFGSGDFSRRVPVTSDDEIGELAVAFNNMAASLSSSEGTRRSFIANVSHELKTPMTTIAGFIDGILDGTIPPDKQNYYLKIVSDEVKRLSRLVKTMLDLSRIDNGELRMNKTCFELRDIILSVMITFEDSIEKKEQASEGIVLSKAFVRTEDGVSYVYKDVNGVLKKQIVKVTQNVNGGMYVLINGGLSMEDKIAFPYSKTAQEGVKTKEGSLDTFMGYDSTSYSGIG